MLSVMMLMPAVSSCKSSSGDDSLEKVLRSNVITVGVDGDDRPFSFESGENSYNGFAVEYFTAIAENLGIKAKFVTVSEEDAKNALDSGEIDCYLGYKNPDRQIKAELLFIEAGYERAQVVIVNEDSPINSLSNMTGKTIGVVRYSDAEDALKQASVLSSELNATIQYGKSEDMILALEDGYIDAAIADELEIMYINNVNSKNIKILEARMATQTCYIGFRRSDTSLQSKISGIISLLREDETLDSLNKKWFAIMPQKEK